MSRRWVTPASVTASLVLLAAATTTDADDNDRGGCLREFLQADRLVHGHVLSP